MSANDPQVITTVHTTRTTTTATTTRSGISFRTEFLKSQQGILLFLTAFYSFVAFLVMISSPKEYLYGSRGFFISVTLVSFVYCCVTYLMLLLNIRSKIGLPWNLVDIIMYGIFFVIMLISSSLVLARGALKSAGSAGTLGCVAVQFYLLLLIYAIRRYCYVRSLTQSGAGATATHPTNLEPAY